MNKKEFSIAVGRTSTKVLNITVFADTEEEAQALALEKAHDRSFYGASELSDVSYDLM